MDPAVEVALVELRRAHPGWGPDRLRYRLAREGVRRVPSRAAIGRALSRLGLITPGGRRARKRQYRAVGAGPADGAVAAGCDGWGAPR
jgi:hypothetical protein